MMEFVVFPASSPTLANGSKIHLVSNINIFIHDSAFTIPILRQMMEFAVFPASSPKLSPGSKIHLISNIYP